MLHLEKKHVAYIDKTFLTNNIGSCKHTRRLPVHRRECYILAITKIQLANITVFNSLELPLSRGMNVFIGENGVGKTHIMKLLYSACKAVRHDVSFAQKVAKVFMPDGASIHRLISRKKNIKTGSVTIYSDSAKISMNITSQTKKWDADVRGEENWEQQLSTLTSTFIPAKEILSNGWHFEAAVHVGNVEFDETYVDVVTAAKIDISAGRDPESRKNYLEILQKATKGKVLLEEDRFYLRPGNQAKIEFSLVAEGIRKLALLWQLIKNGTLEKGAVLFWDEPEANLNPKYIPVVAEMLLELQRNGVQVFVSTHDYFLTKYLEIKRTANDEILYHSLYWQNADVVCETQTALAALSHNTIAETFQQMYKDEIRKAMD